MDRSQQYEEVKKRLERRGIDCREQEPMDRHSTMRVGGPADLFVTVRTGAELAGAVRCCRELGLPFAVIGRGSNLIVADSGVRGVVIRQAAGASAIRELAPGRYALPAGVTLAQAANRAAADACTGLEFAHGIPGTVGGGVFMNAGAYGGELRDVLVSVTVLAPDGELVCLPPEDCGFGYRHSRFARSGELIVEAEVQLAPGDRGAVLARMEELQAARREKQPLEYPSAGSTFKRPPEGTPPAAALIDRCGLKGLRVGNAQVSEKHAGFLINRGGATAADLIELIRWVKAEVFRQTGVLLEEEVRFLGEL